MEVGSVLCVQGGMEASATTLAKRSANRFRTALIHMVVTSGFPLLLSRVAFLCYMASSPPTLCEPRNPVFAYHSQVHTSTYQDVLV